MSLVCEAIWTSLKESVTVVQTHMLQIVLPLSTHYHRIGTEVDVCMFVCTGGMPRQHPKCQASYVSTPIWRDIYERVLSNI